MTHKFSRDFAPSLLLASGIVAAMSVQAACSDLAAMCLLAVAMLAADTLAARLYGALLRPSCAAVVLAVACCLAGCIAMLREPGHTASLIPVFGLGAWVALFMPGGSRRDDCCTARSTWSAS